MHKRQLLKTTRARARALIEKKHNIYLT